jgi:hypothetical protein
MHESEDGVFGLLLRPKNNDFGVLCRRVCPDVAEIQVQCDQDSPFGLRPDRYRRILRSRQAFIGNRAGFEPPSRRIPAQPLGKFSSIFSFKPYVPKEGPPCPRARARQRRPVRPECPVPE